MFDEAQTHEGRCPRHGSTVAHDGKEDERVETAGLDDLNKDLAWLLVRQEAVEGTALVDPTTRALVGLTRLLALQGRERRVRGLAR